MNTHHEVFIDGSNFYATIKMLRIGIDYLKLRNYLFSQGAQRINYLTAIYEDENQHKAIQPLVDWMNYNGFTIISKPAKAKTNSDGVKHVKGNMDVELAVAVMRAAEYCTHVSLFTGDGDFVSLVNAIKQKGVIVTCYSSAKTEPSIVADELRRVVDSFVDIWDISHYFETAR